MFNGDSEKPISIIITTLAAKAYDGSQNLFNAINHIVHNMEQYINKKYNPETGDEIYWIENPVNNSENFADKWANNPNLGAKFFDWLYKLKQDILNISSQTELQSIKTAMVKPFGDKIIENTFNNYGKKVREDISSGNLKMASGTGIIADNGTKIPKHNFHGI
jgi:hypothetical protein